MTDLHAKPWQKRIESMGKGTMRLFPLVQDQKKFQSRTTFEGKRSLTNVLAKGRGCILNKRTTFPPSNIFGTRMPRFMMSTQYTSLQTHPVMNWVMERQRQAYFLPTIEPLLNMPRSLKSLKQNKAVWYACWPRLWSKKFRSLRLLWPPCATDCPHRTQ